MSFYPGRERRVVIYGRVSKLLSGEKQGRSVDSQIEAGKAWAEREGVSVVGIYRDDGVSAYNPRAKRAGWRQVMTAISLGEASELWVWEVSRASREREVWTKLIRTCQANDAILNINGRPHDPNDADDAFMLDLMAALAIRESAQIQKRISRRMQQSAEKGWPHGKIPWAYRRIYDQETGALVAQVPHEERGPILREMVDRFLAGESINSITRDLNRRGIPSPPQVRRQRNSNSSDESLIPWIPAYVRKQLLSPANAGLRQFRGAVVGPASWEGIITAEEHRSIRAILTSKDRRTNRDGAARHLLSGIAECGVCGSRLRRVNTRGHSYYQCPGSDTTNGRCVARVQDKMDALVTYLAVEKLRDPQLAERLAKLHDESSRSAGDAVRRVAELRARLRRFEDQAAQSSDEYVTESFARVVSDIARQIREAEAELNTIAAGVPPLVLATAGPDAAQRWDALSLPQRKQIVRTLFRVIVHRSPYRGPRFRPETVEVRPRF